MSKDVLTEQQLHEKQHEVRVKGEGALGYTTANKNKVNLWSLVAASATELGIGDFTTTPISIVNEAGNQNSGAIIYDSKNKSLDIFWNIANWAEKLMTNDKSLTPEKAVALAIKDFQSGKVTAAKTKELLDRPLYPFYRHDLDNLK